MQKEISAKEVLQKQAELETKLSVATPNVSRITKISEELIKVYKAEELFWRQRSRIMWLQEGDRNSVFFHAVTKGRKARNRITVIEDAEGTPVHEEEDVGKVFTEFYQNLFTTNGGLEFRSVEETISERITPEMNDRLCQIPDQEEVRLATFAIHADKVPGADGFSSGFYHSFWNLLGTDIYREIQAFFTSGSMNPKINETHVCLIPKITAPKAAADYRLIAPLQRQIQNHCKNPHSQTAKIPPRADLAPSVCLCSEKSDFRKRIDHS